MATRQPARQSIAAARKRRTTVNSGQNIKEMLKDDNDEVETTSVNAHISGQTSQDVNQIPNAGNSTPKGQSASTPTSGTAIQPVKQDQHSSGASVQAQPSTVKVLPARTAVNRMARRPVIEEIKEDLEEQEDDNPMLTAKSVQYKVLNSFATPINDEEYDKFFEEDSIKRKRENAMSIRESALVKRTVRSRRRVNMDILDQLKDVESFEQEKSQKQSIEQDMDSLLKEAETINDERRDSKEVNPSISFFQKTYTPKADELKQSMNSGITAISNGGASTVGGRKNKSRFSVLIEDINLKDDIQKTFTVKQVNHKAFVSSGASLPSLKSSHSQVQQDVTESHNQSFEDDSLDSDEDLDGYLMDLKDRLQEKQDQDKLKDFQLQQKLGPSGRRSQRTREDQMDQPRSRAREVFCYINQRIIGCKCPEEDDEIDLKSRNFSTRMSEIINNYEKIQKDENEEQLWDSDDSFTKEFYQNMHQEVLLRTQSEEKRRRTQRVVELTNEDWDYKDALKMIDWNERQYQEQAKDRIKQGQQLLMLKSKKASNVKMSVLGSFTNLEKITNYVYQFLKSDEESFAKLPVDKQVKPTAVSISDEFIFVGMSNGELLIYEIESQELYATFSEKEFLGNTITAIDVHSVRSEYIVIGYQKGQMVLIDTTEPKNALKIIKDHHQKRIINIKFCDWSDGKKTIYSNQDNQEPEDLEAWMFISIDNTGKVLINTVSKILFILIASKYVAYDPIKATGQLYMTVACRFSSRFHGQGIYDDMALGAIANEDHVIIFEARAGRFNELHKIQRPTQYYDATTSQLEDIKATVPKLAWGYGMSPVLRDRPHSLLAIAWGPIIQIVVFIDNEDSDNPFIMDGYYILKCHETKMGKKKDKVRKSVRFEENHINDIFKTIQEIQGEQHSEGTLSFDVKESDTKTFNIPELAIEQLLWLSDSVLMIVTQSNEIRILYTQAFNPESYTPEKPMNRAFMKLLEKSEKPELEDGILIKNLYRSDFNVDCSHSIKFFGGKLVVMANNQIQINQHLTWQQSIYEFMRKVEDDLSQVFTRSLQIYKGKIKGYAGIPDDAFLRQRLLKVELKLLIKEIIQKGIEKAKRETPVFNRFATKVTCGTQDHDYDRQKLEYLTKIVIEFCMALKDSDFLFKDLFWVFQEEKVEDVFLCELEPFILSGSFKDWEIPNDIIKDHLITYYKNPLRIDQLEKIIINLNLNLCPKTIILEFIHFSEQYFLISAVLCLYTQVFEKKDNTACIKVLFSLLELYTKSMKKELTKKIDLKILKDEFANKEEKRAAEKSHKYIGYKLLWVLKLFLNGRKYPQGYFREKKWRTYIHDIVQFISNQKILKTLLEIDAEAFFQVIAILFYQSKPYELLQAGREKDTKNQDLQVITHAELIRILDSFCLSFEAREPIKTQYLFFAGNVVAKSPITGLDQIYYYNIARELMSINKKYLDFCKNLQQMSTMRKKKVHKRLSTQGIQTFLRYMDEQRYIEKAENDYIALIKKSEPLDNLQLTDLLKLAENTQFNQVKIFLLERKEEYIKCLQMLLSDLKLSEALTAEQQAEEILFWIKQKIILLEQRAPRSIIDRNICEQFKREVAQSIKKVVSINPLETVRLIEERFCGNHKEMIDSLNRDPIEQMQYLDAFVDEYDQIIQETITNYGLKSTNPQEAKKYIEFLKLHLKLCCQFQQEKVQSIIEKIVRNSYYPIQECLEICQQYEQKDATFILNKKLGKYYESVQQGIAIIKEKLDVRKLMIEIYFAQKSEMSLKFCINNEYLPECTQLDAILKKIFKICRKNSKEVEKEKEELIWYIVIDALLDIRKDDLLVKKTYCKLFFQERLNLFIQQMISVIPIKNFLNHIFDKTYDILFKDLRGIIKDVFYKMGQEQIVLQNANNSIFKVNTELFQEFSQQSRRGILFRQRVCGTCKRYMDSSFNDEQDQGEDEELDVFQYLNTFDDLEDEIYIYDSSKELIKIFACRHAFHIRCLEKHHRVKYGEELDIMNSKKNEKLRCPTCNLKEYDLDQESIQNQSMKNKKFQQLATVRDRVTSVARVTDGKSIHESIERKQQMHQMKMTMISQTIVSKQLFKMSKKMNFYEQHKMNTWLNINDFKI